LVREKGLESMGQRHERCHRATMTGLHAMGLALFAQGSHWLPALGAICVPEGLDDRKVRARLLQGHGIEVGRGPGPLKG